MYVMIFKDLSFVQIRKLSKTNLSAADSKIIKILDVSQGDYPLRYNKGRWESIPILNQTER